MTKAELVDKVVQDVAHRELSKAAVNEVVDAVFDNIAKSVLDGCESALWGNDKQVTRLTVERCTGGAPRVEVEVETLAAVCPPGRLRRKR